MYRIYLPSIGSFKLTFPEIFVSSPKIERRRLVFPEPTSPTIPISFPCEATRLRFNYFNHNHATTERNHAKLTAFQL